MAKKAVAAEKKPAKKKIDARIKKTSHPNKTVEKVVNKARRAGGTKAAVKVAKKIAKKAGPEKVTQEAVKASMPVVVPSKKQVEERMTRKQAKAAADAAATKELAPLAKEINHRLELADKMDGKADDHRLSAALQLEAARKKCHEMKVPFKKWCEANVAKSFHTIRKLAAVGASPEPKKALQDLRENNRIANKVLRENKKLEEQELRQELRQAKRGASRDAKPTDPARSPDAPAPRNTSVVTLDVAQSTFNALSATDKVEFIKWCAEDLGFGLYDPTSQEIANKE